MNEKFRLAANVFLKRRLNNLVRLDDNIEIDRDFITCAEYQLFIDDMRQQGKNRQPDHWKSERFPPGWSQQPVTGVRAKDAEEFCQWLTEKEIERSFSYRLPNIIEAQKIPATRMDIGCWSKERNTYTISGIPPEQWQIWQGQLSEYLVIIDSFDLDQDLSQVLDLDFYLDLDLDLDLYLNRNLALDLNLYFYQNRDLYRDLDLNLYFYRNRDLYRNLDLYRYLDLNTNLYRYLYKKIDDRKANNPLLIYFYLIFVIIFYKLLKRIYENFEKNKKERNKINLSRQKCKKLSKAYAQKTDEMYLLYVYLVLIDERINKNMPAWEGIRIVRERD